MGTKARLAARLYHVRQEPRIVFRSGCMSEPVPTPVQVIVSCIDLDATMLAYEPLGFRLDMIMPADAPRIASMSAPGVTLRLETASASVAGRAGMLYRDLIPGRLGGRVIASHIRIPQGGPVPDYVHYHHVRFQMIYCAKGWVRVVYQDQGAPFVMHEGDCVLQPPGIRHRVLESSPGLEVIEVSAPAEHETWRDHVMSLPTTEQAECTYDGQRFVRHVARDAVWVLKGGFDVRDTGISVASGGAGGVRVLRATGKGLIDVRAGAGGIVFLAVLSGACSLAAGDAASILNAGDARIVDSRARATIEASGPCEVLCVDLRIDD